MTDTHSTTAPQSNNGVAGDLTGITTGNPGDPNGRPLPKWAWRFAVPVALVILVLLAFMDALTAGFVDWDDDDLLITNTIYQSLNVESLRWMFTTSYAGHFQPLTWLSYTLDYALWNGDPLGYHLTNVVLHAAATVAFYFVARYLLALAAGRSRSREELSCESPLENRRRDNPSENRWCESPLENRWCENPFSHPPDRHSAPFVLAATFAALLFAVHPLRAESVAWIAERRDVLSGFLYILAIGAYLRFCSAGKCRVGIANQVEENGGPCPPYSSQPRLGLRSRPGVWYAVALLLCLLSLLAKASAVTLPLVLLILDVYPLGRLGACTTSATGGGRYSPSATEQGRTAVAVWLEKLPFFLFAAVAGGRALLAQHQGGALSSLAGHDVWSRLAQACYGLTFYLKKTICPLDLGPLYQLPSREVLMGPMLWISLIALTVIIVVVVRVGRRFPAVPAALAVYVVILLPVLGFAQSGPQLVADRYSYLSCLGLAVLAGGAVLHLLVRKSWGGDSRKRALLALGCVSAVAALAFGTRKQNEIWQDGLDLWHHGVRVSPQSSIAHANFADALAQSSLMEAAVPHYESALELDPGDVIATAHLANVLQLLHRPREAEAMHRRALQLDPDRSDTRGDLAQLLIDAGRVQDALEVLREGARRTPLNVSVVAFLAELLTTHPDKAVRNGPEAVKWASQASRARGDVDPDLLMTLASALAEAGRFDEAMEVAARAHAIATQRGNDRLAEELARRLNLFREGKPYHFGEE